MAQHIKYYSSLDAGAPQLINAAGSLISLLDACLVTGFNSKAVSSVVVAGGVATVNCLGHGYPLDNLYRLDLDVTMGGANTAAINGAKLITVVNADNFTFPAPGVPDGAISGTITCKRTPLGWAKPHSDTNKAMYARTHPQATTHLLRVEDPAGEDAIIMAVESATGVDAFVDRVPTAAQLASGYYWTKGANNTRAKNWAILGDDFGFYILTDTSGYSDSATWQSTFNVQWFGDIITRKAGDMFHCVVSGGRTINSTTGGQSILTHAAAAGWNGSLNSSTASAHLMRGHTALVKSVGIELTFPGGLLNTPNKWYPDVIGNGGIFARGVYVSEDTASQGYPVRGRMPGLVQPLFRASDTPYSQTPVPLTMTDGSGELLWYFRIPYNTSDNYHVCFSLNRPWR